ncbi:MazG-like protein [Clostridium sp. UBA1652]|uniref:MazG-like protein n=1 Tax=Clostridium sp. UBA1652 TaxID=1946348 RepID=UPI00257F7DAF|nr:MazG-like protein [Clostridium sp. UBA1652]
MHNNELNLNEIIKRSIKIRDNYHELEKQYHGSKWSVEEDALAFLTDAGLVGRLTMANEKRWPVSGDEVEELKHKLSECIWWIIVLADRMNIDISKSLYEFLTSFEIN